jgi:hypothetical protein
MSGEFVMRNVGRDEEIDRDGIGLHDIFVKGWWWE